MGEQVEELAVKTRVVPFGYYSMLRGCNNDVVLELTAFSLH